MSSQEYLTIDTLISNALDICRKLPSEAQYRQPILQLQDLCDRLAAGILRIAVMGQFNRGKSTFINALLQTNILPVSVLPLTSVPTYIAYGENNGCEIMFADTEKPLCVEGNTERIQELLARYVTEDNNPNNSKKVLKATVYCNNLFLKDGTLLIDTPGFGSTFIHNTKTTVDLLSSCDAVLFLLSADLPITQVEIDFLKHVLPIVPKLFFIYNKIDILNTDEIILTRNFIRKTLQNALGVSKDIVLYAVSAKNAFSKEYGESSGNASGLEKIQDEIIDFLRKEKYFTLSQALIVKFKDALNRIVAILNENYRAINDPLSEKRDMLGLYHSFSTNLAHTQHDAMNLAAGKEKNVIHFHTDLMSRKNEEIWALIKEFFEKFFRTLPLKNHDSLIQLSFNRLFEEVFNRFVHYAVSEYDKCIMGLMKEQTTALMNAVKTVQKKVSLSDLNPDTIGEDLEKIRFPQDWAWKPEKPFVPVSIRISFFDRFFRKKIPFARLFDHYAPQMRAYLEKETVSLSHKLRNLIVQVFEQYRTALKDTHHCIGKTLENKSVLEDASFNKKEKEAEPVLRELQSLVDSIEAIKRELI